MGRQVSKRPRLRLTVIAWRKRENGTRDLPRIEISEKLFDSPEFFHSFGSFNNHFFLTHYRFFEDLTNYGTVLTVMSIVTNRRNSKMVQTWRFKDRIHKLRIRKTTSKPVHTRTKSNSFRALKATNSIRRGPISKS